VPNEHELVLQVPTPRRTKKIMASTTSAVTSTGITTSQDIVGSFRKQLLFGRPDLIATSGADHLYY
jgi:hypothetical protein